MKHSGHNVNAAKLHQLSQLNTENFVIHFSDGLLSINETQSPQNCLSHTN